MPPTKQKQNQKPEKLLTLLLEEFFFFFFCGVLCFVCLVWFEDGEMIHCPKSGLLGFLWFLDFPIHATPVICLYKS